MKKTQILLLTAAYTLAFGYYGCKKSEPAPAIAPDETPAVAATVQARPSAAPADYVKKETYFKLPEYRGGEVDLASYAGKPVLVMFFTENCPYCRKAAPFIARMSAEFAPKGLKTVGVCLEDTASSAAGFARDFKLSFPIAYDGQSTARNYRAQGVPFIYLLGKDHAIKNYWAGYDPRYDDDIRNALQEITK